LGGLLRWFGLGLSSTAADFVVVLVMTMDQVVLMAGAADRARRFVCAVAGLVAMSMHARAAAAQSLGGYLAPSFATPGTGFSSRLGTGYTTAGVAVGDFVVRPSASETFGYDSNPAGLARPRGSAFYDTEAGLQTGADWTRASLGLGLSFANRRYLSAAGQDSTDWAANAQGSVAVGGDQANWGLSHLSLTDVPNSIDNPGLTQPVSYSVNAGQLGYRTSFNRLSLDAQLYYTSTRYANTTSGVATEAYRSNDTWQPTLTARYDLSLLTKLVVVGQGTSITYLSRQPGQPSQNSLGFTLLGGVELASGSFETGLLVGYQQRTYVAAQYGTTTAPVIEGSVIWTPNGLTTITGRLTRSIQQSASPSIPGFTSTTADLKVDYEFRPNILWHTDVSSTLADYTQSGGSTSQLGASFGATWLINRVTSLGGTITFVDSQSTQTNSFTDSVASLQIALKL